MHDPAVALLGIYSREMKTYVITKTCTWLFVALLVVINKQTKPETTKISLSKWMFKSALVHTYNGIQLNNKKVEQPMWTAWMGLEGFMLGEKNKNDLKKPHTGDFPGVQWLILCLPMQGLWVRSQIRRAKIPHASWPKKSTHKTETILHLITNSVKTLKSGPPQKKIF